MKWSFYVLLIFIVSWTACGDPSPEKEGTLTNNQAIINEPLPTTPEGVVRLYQKYLDENKFAKAKRLSTPKEGERLQILEKIISGDLLDSTLVKTVFVKLNCQEKDNVATCFGVYKEDGEEYEDEFRLSKINGQWLVDVTEEEIFLETEEVVNDLEK